MSIFRKISNMFGKLHNEEVAENTAPAAAITVAKKVAAQPQKNPRSNNQRMIQYLSGNSPRAERYRSIIHHYRQGKDVAAIMRATGASRHVVNSTIQTVAQSRDAIEHLVKMKAGTHSRLVIPKSKEHAAVKGLAKRTKRFVDGNPVFVFPEQTPNMAAIANMVETSKVEGPIIVEFPESLDRIGHANLRNVMNRTTAGKGFRISMRAVSDDRTQFRLVVI